MFFKTVAFLDKYHHGYNFGHHTEDIKDWFNKNRDKMNDIDLRLNNSSTQSECSYQAATIYLKDGTIVNIPFLNTNNNIYEIASHTALYNKFVSAIAKYNQTTTGTLILDFEIDLVDDDIMHHLEEFTLEKLYK